MSRAVGWRPPSAPGCARCRRRRDGGRRRPASARARVRSPWRTAPGPELPESDVLGEVATQSSRATSSAGRARRPRKSAMRRWAQRRTATVMLRLEAARPRPSRTSRDPRRAGPGRARGPRCAARCARRPGLASASRMSAWNVSQSVATPSRSSRRRRPSGRCRAPMVRRSDEMLFCTVLSVTPRDARR